MGFHIYAAWSFQFRRRQRQPETWLRDNTNTTHDIFNKSRDFSRF